MEVIEKSLIELFNKEKNNLSSEMQKIKNDITSEIKEELKNNINNLTLYLLKILNKINDIQNNLYIHKIQNIEIKNDKQYNEKEDKDKIEKNINYLNNINKNKIHTNIEFNNFNEWNKCVNINKEGNKTFEKYKFNFEELEKDKINYKIKENNNRENNILNFKIIYNYIYFVLALNNIMKLKMIIIIKKMRIILIL